MLILELVSLRVAACPATAGRSFFSELSAIRAGGTGSGHLPFGGGGGSASGVGRVGGRYAMEALSQVRTVVLSGLA